MENENIRQRRKNNEITKKNEKQNDTGRTWNINEKKKKSRKKNTL